MSNSIDAGDDWFASGRQQAVEVPEPPREDGFEWEPEDPVSRDLGRRHAGIVLAVIVAIFLVLAGFVVGRTTKDSSTTVVTVTAVSEVPVTPAVTTPAETTPTTTTTTPAETTPTTNPADVPADTTLRPGMTGSSSVAALQTALTALGYAPGAADGGYGTATTEAVAAFQTASGLTADGVAGPKTIVAVNTALARG
ncbi:MAG: peptidoglycan-binding domain-containing protein [Thermoleophilia bacterium]